MKQITPEIKARIFALYYGQDICYWPTSFESPFQKVIITDYTMRNAWLEVNPLSSIIDEDAIEVADIIGVYTDNSTKINVAQSLIKRVISHQHTAMRAITSGEAIFIFDYLRSKGYALPYMNWSVSDLVAAGVFKLKEVNNE